MKKGFSLIMAIFFVMLIATLGMMSLSLSSKIVKQSGDIYLKEQAELYAMSATSLAVLDMQGTDYTKGCFTNKTYDFGDGFKAEVNVFYLDSDMPQCGDNKYSKPINKDFVTFEHVDGTKATYYNIALIDVMVQNTDGIEPVRFHRRTVQRP